MVCTDLAWPKTMQAMGAISASMPDQPCQTYVHHPLAHEDPGVEHAQYLANGACHFFEQGRCDSRKTDVNQELICSCMESPPDHCSELDFENLDFDKLQQLNLKAPAENAA